MDFFRIMVKILIILLSVLAVAFPFWLEYQTFKKDKKKKISYKRFRVLVFSIVYMIGITIALYFLKNFLAWVQSLRFVQWIINKIGLQANQVYFGKVIVTLLANFAIGMLFWLLTKLVRIGLKNKNLTKASGKKGFNWRQKAERAVIKFFHTETWFFVGRILKYLTIILSVLYSLLFAVYMVPAIFQASWIPYNLIMQIFESGYLYPAITMLGLWQAYFFLEGIKRVQEECPELLKEDDPEKKKIEDALKEIDKEIKKQFQDYYVCDVELPKPAEKEDVFATHHKVTKLIGEAVEADKRNPHKCEEVYLSCVDRLIQSEKSVLINGGFFSEFSVYFLRYLSVIIARGDNVVFVCNSDNQIDAVYDYIRTGLAQMVSLYCKDFSKEAVDFDDSLWRVVKVSGEHEDIEESTIDDHSILVTTLAFLCSTKFESRHKNFANLIDTVVFVDTLETVNKFNRQMTILNTRLKHLAHTNEMDSKNGNTNKGFRVRYMSRQVRYICFDDTRVPGLDKALKNMLAVEFDSVDAMRYDSRAMVRCYKMEGKRDEDGRFSCSKFIHSDEEISVVMNVAMLCLAKGASNVTIFADRIIPYENIAETISANRGQILVTTDENTIRLNKHFYNPQGYSVVIALDSGDNLPETIRRYAAMLSEQPVLLMVFSRPYMLRDYYLENIADLWRRSQIARIPVETRYKVDVAQRILVKANAGGISEKELLELAADIPELEEYVKDGDINAILRGVLKVYGYSEEQLNLFKVFEYKTIRDFDEHGIYQMVDKILLRKQGKLFELINGRDMVVMNTGENEIVLPLPGVRLTQNYIAGQNLLYNGSIYHINKIDTDLRKIYAKLAVSGLNDESFQYLQEREYRVEVGEHQLELAFPTKHLVLNSKKSSVRVTDAYISAFRAPMDVVTRGYYEVDAHSMSVNVEEGRYHRISDEQDDFLARQTYRRYGIVEKPYYSSEKVRKKTDLIAYENKALMMKIRIKGQFEFDINRTAALAAAMLNEIIHAMFPSVADAVVVCPVLHGENEDAEHAGILKRHPQLTLSGEHGIFSDSDLELMIIEDCETDLGVVSVLMSGGDDILQTLFAPVYEYLKWYSESNEKSSYLYFGLEQEPGCYDFESLMKLAGVFGEKKLTVKYEELDTVVEYETCDFCCKRYQKGSGMTELEDGRRMCRDCAESLVGNNKKALREHLKRAKVYLESTYGISLDDDYDFCFDSTMKIANILKQNRNLPNHSADIPLKTFIDEKKKIHVEYAVPSASLSEILVRQLTYVWQLKHLPDLKEELVEGHIALVAVQYMRFLGEHVIANTRTAYYDSTKNISGVGYRKIVRGLLENPQYHSNSFRYLAEMSGVVIEDESSVQPLPVITGEGIYGLPYPVEKMDRSLDGTITYFYYERLEVKLQKIYELLLEAIKNHKEKITIEGICFDQINKTVDAIKYDHPELFAYRTFSVCGDEISLVYGVTKEEEEQIQSQIDEAVSKYMENIDDSMSAYDVTLRFHVQMINVVDYDTIALDEEKKKGGPARDKIDPLRSIYGVFIDGKAVCEGYARAMQYLLQKCGIECAEVLGQIVRENGETDGWHAWNIVKLDGDYYYLDTTWDDSSNTNQKIKRRNINFNYFAITTEELLRSRNLKSNPVDLPNCISTRCNYYYHNHLILESYDVSKITEFAKEAAKNELTSFTFKCKYKAVFEAAMKKLCINGKECYEILKIVGKQYKWIKMSDYTYSYDDNIMTITIMFKRQ